MIVSGLPYIPARWVFADGDGLKYGFAIHATDNKNRANAFQEAANAAHREDKVSTHFFIDKHNVVQVMDTLAKAAHAGSSTGNENAIAFEFCGMTTDPREWWLENIDWPFISSVMVEVIHAHWPNGGFEIRRATVEEMKTTPRVKALYSHNDMRLAWGGTDHTDPGDGFPWDWLFDNIMSFIDYGKREDTKMPVYLITPKPDYDGSVYELLDGGAPTGLSLDDWQMLKRIYPAARDEALIRVTPADIQRLTERAQERAGNIGGAIPDHVHTYSDETRVVITGTTSGPQ